MDLARSAREPKVGVVTAAVASEDGEEGVVEVVAPLRIHSVASGFERGDEARIVEVAFGDDDVAAAGVSLEPADFGGELFHEVDGRAVGVGVHGVEAKAIEMVVAEPQEALSQKKRRDSQLPRSSKLTASPQACGGRW